MVERVAFFYFFLAAVLLISGCKSARKSLKNGNYDRAVTLAAEKLKASPAHESSIEALREAYPRAVSQHLTTVKKLESDRDGFFFEAVADEYRILNRLNELLRSCPACLETVEARSFRDEEDNARLQAAATRYEAGNRQMARPGRQAAKEAFFHFEKALSLVPDYKDAADRKAKAFDAASIHVVVEQVPVTSRTYQLSNEYFQDQINEFLKSNKTLNKFVQFYTPDEASALKLRPDQVITLQFDDFVVGQTLIERNTETVTSKDSVKTGEATTRAGKVPVYGKVTAKFTLSKKTVVSSGLLDFSIVSFADRKQLHREKLHGEHTWFCEWGSFKGDERALTPQQARLCKLLELNPPPPQQLFIEFSKPLYEQLTNKLKSFYASY